MPMKSIYTGFVVFIISITSSAQQPAPGTYQLDSKNSSLQIDVFRGGLFGFLGHDHTVTCKQLSGTVQIDSVRLEDSLVSVSLETTSLKILDPGVSDRERDQVQATMESPKVLNVLTYPTITFQSTQVEDVSGVGEDLEIELTGILNLHGIERKIMFPARVRFERDLLRATGTATINQTDFGIIPIRLAGGTVRVKDQVALSFDIQAKREF